MSDLFLKEAARLLGPKGLTTEPSDLAPWLTDWRGRYTGQALAMASPASTHELSALVRLCHQHGVPIVPQGGNSGMSGGATPFDSGRELLLSLRRMNQIRGIDSASRTATCDAGVILQVLHEAAEAHHLRFPLSLGGKGSATIGGLIATNAGGTQVLRHGSMRALVLGVEAVMADGSVLDLLTPLKKDNRGFDLKQLLIGSEGTLGIISAATLALVPTIAGRVVMWAGTSSLHEARSLLLLAQDMAADQLEGFEVLPQHSLDAVLDYLPDARAPLADAHEWHALIELVATDSQTAARLPEMAESLLGTALHRGLIADATIAASEDQANRLWLIRESISPAERAIGPAMQHDISVPVERMPAFVEAVVPRLEADWPGTRAVCFGHLGDGNVHFHVIAPPGKERSAWEAGDGKAISAQVHDLVVAWGGSISAEHGIGRLKRDELARLEDPARIAVMRAVKQALDPQGLLNPGKLV
ncbi:MAG: hydroxyacid dehydrogenase [Novosphingobium sp. 28-62-57]|uniref:FAD-binding oxidoreductase n=1 Tax=unclassified Novosphingobium TaxID=2644732 RepID=UPI000BC6940D|nr:MULTISPECIES: FAD-binding oxidoreductase [unclassified Novosphingobium]OYW49337.1 MAG: hydroxyacid dehydrogenase [Novosphingobium sp. 12-62-10]OYZ09093.1 MAG: hydroxyacid dehydrogenase [Novosphingobium sp. 28-62-57]OZA35709.1 MAG: hydroxyacid dehydrogenase [Novosphingobium sp. 17-62-9]HQS70262.1 FAD-binding oxidoreductase [Novosphingobium sp.]